MNILIALSDQYFGEAIVAFMRSRKWPSQTRVQVMHVIEPGDEYSSPKEHRVSRQKKFLEHIAFELKLHNPEIETEKVITFGLAAESILKQAREGNADLIVMGSSGRKGLERLLMGSVSGTVSTKADCSVAVVKPVPSCCLDVSLTEEDLPQSVCDIDVKTNKSLKS
jgi:nucleotide-binding universal stress UspA family protein